ncbi:melatonin receptor type 1B-A-like [Amphiura filiformis]|uniref:melatonin receptor type 1B-A-like n=1 Tax=Amphiura filiformis TaxID=82378 RepID=UPI003B221172
MTTEFAVTTSNLSSSHGHGEGAPIFYAENVFVAIMNLLIFFIGSIGNFGVILAVLFCRKLQTTTNVFVFSLSCADLITSLFLFWLAVARLSPSFGWPWPRAYWLCKVSAYLVFTCFGVSVYNLAAISVNRLILITRPNIYTKIYTRFNIAVMISITWLLPLVVGAALPLAGIGGFGYDHRDHTCSDLDNLPTAHLFSLAHTIVGLPVPLLVLTFSYARIYIHVRRHFGKQLRQQKEMSVSVTMNGSTVCTVPSAACERRQAQIIQQQLEITKNLFTVFIIFVIIIAPFFIFNLFPQNSPVSYRINLYLSVPFLANSAINPLIYAARHPQFKGVLRLMMLCKYREIPEQTAFLQRFTKTLN